MQWEEHILVYIFGMKQKAYGTGNHLGYSSFLLEGVGRNRQHKGT